jgi:DNA-binding PadR family transcriptional regulator
MRRGDVRAAILVLLDEEPRNGYQLMQEVEARSDGAWRPSPGSVYPALALLEDESLIRSEEEDGSKHFVLTDAGKTHVEENREKLGEPWANLGETDGSTASELKNQIKPLIGAVGQVFQTGSEQHMKAAAAVLADARRKIYGILAEDSPKDEN